MPAHATQTTTPARRRRPGRPAETQLGDQPSFVGAYVSLEEREIVGQIAARWQLNQSATIRRLIRDEAAREERRAALEAEIAAIS